jgi:hypothetical protein
MNREIKFRYIFRYKASGNIEVKHYYLNQLEERNAKQLSPCFLSDYELLSRDQYTGLLDDNGVEIYEGNIVEAIDEPRINISEVAIHPLGVYIKAHPFIEEVTGKEIELLYNYCDYGMGRGITQKCYVLGTVIENPELLSKLNRGNGIALNGAYEFVLEEENEKMYRDYI